MASPPAGHQPVFAERRSQWSKARSKSSEAMALDDRVLLDLLDPFVVFLFGRIIYLSMSFNNLMMFLDLFGSISMFLLDLLMLKKSGKVG